MKHLIIAAIVCVGLVAQPVGFTVGSAPQTSNGQSTASTPINTEINSQQLSASDMGNLIGGDATGCWDYVDENMDKHTICCVDLWIITICAGVNWSAIERLLDF